MVRQRKADIKTVAKMAGVSIATVSRALKNPELVSKKNLEKVRDAVSKSGYTPNKAGRMLRTQRSGNALVIFPDITRPFNSGIIHGIENVAHEVGYSLLLSATRDQKSREIACTNTIFSGQADGMILLCPRLPFDAEGFPNKNLPPLVNVSEPVEKADFPRVLIDNISAATLAVNHLIDLGHKNIAIITGNVTDPSGRDRLEGYKAALLNAGFKVNPDYIQYGNYSPESGMNCAHRLLQQKPRPTAIFCCDDEMAIAAMLAARSLRISVPEDLSLVGFDDIWCSEYQSPPLTTVRQPVVKMGELAMQLLYDLMNDKPSTQDTVYLPVELVVRESTCPPKRG